MIVTQADKNLKITGVYALGGAFFLGKNLFRCSSAGEKDKLFPSLYLFLSLLWFVIISKIHWHDEVQLQFSLWSIVVYILERRTRRIHHGYLKGTPPLFFDDFQNSKTVSPIGLKFLSQIDHLIWWDKCSRKKNFLRRFS